MLCGAEHTKISTLSYCHLSTQQNHFQGMKSCVKDQCKSWYHCHTKALHSSHTPQTENTAGPTSSAAAAISWYLMLMKFILSTHEIHCHLQQLCFTSDSAQEQQWSPFVDINRYNSLISLWKKKKMLGHVHYQRAEITTGSLWAYLILSHVKNYSDHREGFSITNRK